jgi:hypothetical protein
MTFAPTDTHFDAILEFLASSPTAEELVNYQPPEAMQQRLDDLLEANRKRGLSEPEQTELDEYLRMNRFMSRLKLKARQRLSP